MTENPQLAEDQAAAIRQMLLAAPEQFPDLAAVQAAARLDAEELRSLTITHFHTTPELLLRDAQMRKAAVDLLAGADPAGINEAEFRAWAHMTPAAYAQLGAGTTFTLDLPGDYPHQAILAYIGRDKQSLTEQLDGMTFRIAQRIEDTALLLRLDVAQDRVRVSVAYPQLEDPGRFMPEVHRRALRILGLRNDPSAFEAQMRADPEAPLALVVAEQAGLRVPQVADTFDALTWAILGQQINLRFAYQLRRNMTEAFSEPLAEGLWAPLSMETAANLEVADLMPHKFSGRKAEYIIGVARAGLDGVLPLHALADLPAPTLERTLQSQRGIGPWSANYLMMRHFSLLDCVPVGDTGLTGGLQRIYNLEVRPDRERTLELLERYRPFRSLATYHIWRRAGTFA